MARVVVVLLPLALVAAMAGCTATTSPVSPSAARSGTTAATAGTPSAAPPTTVIPPSSAAASPSAMPSASASASATSASGNGADAGAPAGQCADEVLKVSLSMPKGAAGSFEQDLVFTNTGTSSCVLRGTPGLSVVGDGDGTQLGEAAARNQTGARTVRLPARGGQAYALFGGPELGPGSEGAAHCSGGVRSGDGYRVYPPHSRRAFFVRDRNAAACTTGGAFLHVQVVLPLGTAR